MEKTLPLDGAETIVVGAGSSGCVIAARVTERASNDVLLVEAGPDYPGDDALPDELRDGNQNARLTHDWGFWEVPVDGRRAFAFPRGRVVGGSSAVNTCIALRGAPYDFDEWASMGLADWSFEKCLPAFKRFENDMDPWVEDRWHGRDGPIKIRRHAPDELSPWQQGFLDACARNGFRACDDFNAPLAHGYGAYPMNKIAGERMSAARGYLTPEVRRRENLRVVPDTHVVRVRIERERVTGVDVEHHGSLRTIRASRVVLCAGAICTPGILLRSGIGSRADLERIGVPRVRELPGVAARLLDHQGTVVLLRPREEFAGYFPLIQCGLRCSTRGGLFPHDLLVQAASFLWLPRGRLPLYALTASLQRPRGAGRIVFTSADARARPRLHGDFLVHPLDREALHETLELMELIASTEPLRSMAELVYPRAATFDRRESLRHYLEGACGSGYHPCGTAPMGSDDDAMAVTDGRGRVRGVEGLYVADASLMPTIPSSNIHLSVLMIAERFGEWLRTESS